MTCRPTWALVNSPHRWVLIFMLVSALRAATFWQDPAGATRMVPHVGPAEISGPGQSGAPSRHDLPLEFFPRIGNAENLVPLGSAAAVALTPRAVSCFRRHLEGWLLAENLIRLIVP